MNEIVNEFISQYGVTILYAIITAVVSYVGMKIKSVFEKYINDKTKRDVAKTCVRAVEQIYKDLHGQEKLDKCIESISLLLADKGISITEIEVRMLIEAAVREMNAQLGDLFKDDDKEIEAEPQG